LMQGKSPWKISFWRWIELAIKEPFPKYKMAVVTLTEHLKQVRILAMSRSCYDEVRSIENQE